MANRKLRNLGGTFEETINPYFNGPPSAETRTSIVFIERFILAILRSEIERLTADPGDRSEINRIFGHIFDPSATAEMRHKYVANFCKSPPQVVLGYPRVSAEFPCYSVTLDSDEEADPALLGKYAGATLEGEIPANNEDLEFEGAFFTQRYTVYVYAEHPDVCSYLYQLAKMILFGARSALEAAGGIDLHYGGGELRPDEGYIPENMFARYLTVTCTSMMTVPRVLTYRLQDQLRVTGIFAEDVVVEGVQGGVHGYVPGVEDDE